MNDLEPPKQGVLVFFCNFWLRCTLQRRTATKRLKNQDNVQTGTAKAVAHLMSFAQITCYNPRTQRL